jgi:mannosyltransferase
VGGGVRSTVHFDDIIFSLQKFGGISTYWRQLERALKRHTPIDVLRSGGSRLTRLLPVRSRATVFHSSYFRVPLSRRTRYVVTVHDLAFELGVVRKPSSDLSRFVRGRAISRADAIVCVSESTKGELLSSYPSVRDHPRILVIHHGCGCIPDESIGQGYSSTTNPEPFVLFVGSRDGYKNFHLALEGFAMSRFGKEALLVCSGAPFTSAETAYIRRLNLEGRVINKSPASPATLIDLYRNANALLYPSSYEGFGFPLVEAMAAGCPVIAANRSVIPEIAGDAAMLIQNLEVETIADAIDRVVEPREGARLARLGVENASRFTWARSAESHARLYAELMAP